MGANRLGIKRAALLAVTVLALAGNAPAAPRFKVLHAFGRGNDGGGVWGGLVLDDNGNLYGTTSGGGGTGCNGSGCGTVFELVRRTNSRWKEKVLHRFDGADGEGPIDGLALDAAANLYGMTTGGGPNGNQFGTVFELSPGSGGWTVNVLHDRGGSANLILDQAGNLYGPIGGPGQYGGGAISELVKDNGWAESWLYSFCPKYPCVDGAWPFAGVTWGPDGSLYGTTPTGGKYQQYCGGGCGVVFQLTPQQDGIWKETVLHSFPTFLHDGSELYDSVTLDQLGNLYGATAQGGGGGHDCGVIFELSPQASGKWKETILYDFPSLSQGCGANTMTFDAEGNLWGTTVTGGSGICSGGCGVVFEMTPQANGRWKYNVVL